MGKRPPCLKEAATRSSSLLLHGGCLPIKVLMDFYVFNVDKLFQIKKKNHKTVWVHQVGTKQACFLVEFSHEKNRKAASLVAQW